MDKIQVIALYGKSASGKDTIQRHLCAAFPNVFNPIVSCTTRPKRWGEADGKDYHFLTLQEFTTKVVQGEMLEATAFRDWFYGTPLDSLNPTKINIGVFNIAGVETLLGYDNLQIYPVFVQAEDSTRLMRSLTRETKPDCEEICRRFFADQKDFETVPFQPAFVFLNENDENDEDAFEEWLKVQFGQNFVIL